MFEIMPTEEGNEINYERDKGKRSKITIRKKLLTYLTLIVRDFKSGSFH
jgi:hypothetical protein